MVEHEGSTRTAQEAADRAGCKLGQIVKSLIFKGRDSGKPILVLTSGANRVDEKRISQYAGEAITRPDADFVRAVTGFAIGGVPPIGHVFGVGTRIDAGRSGAVTFDARYDLGPTARSEMSDETNASFYFTVGYQTNLRIFGGGH